VIEPAFDWSCDLRDDGLVLAPREAPAQGMIRYYARRAPLVTLEQIVASLPAPVGYAAATRSPPERLVTVEGEHGVLIAESGVLDRGPAERTVAVVYGDDFYTVLVGLARHPRGFDRIRGEVRRLARHDLHRLGVRRRRFLHAPPPGWHGFASGPLQTRWAPLDYPRRRAMIVVEPAVPIADGWDGAAGLPCDGAVRTRAGLTGHRWRRDGRAGERRELVVLADRRYLYPVAIDRHLADVAAALTFDALVDSIEPVPAAAPRRALGAEAFAYLAA
jgi:hypothetical protein